MGSDEQRQAGGYNPCTNSNGGQAPIQKAQHRPEGSARSRAALESAYPTLTEHPVVDAEYTDYTGRILRVVKIQPCDPLGREVIGKLKTPGKDPRSYATKLDIFYAIWVKRLPPMNPNDVKVG